MMKPFSFAETEQVNDTSSVHPTFWQVVANKIGTDHYMEPSPTQLETLKILESDPYYYMCPAVKEWIEQDQKVKYNHDDDKNSSSGSSIDDLSFLMHLDINIKYEIIEFIPTYSKWKGLRAIDEYYNEIEFPKIHRRERIEQRLDQPMVTFHKMRIISKHFNMRMMRKLLVWPEFFITNIRLLKWYLKLFRMQTKFSENGNKLPQDCYLLYDDEDPQVEKKSNSAFGGFNFNFSFNTGIETSTDNQEITSNNESDEENEGTTNYFGTSSAFNSSASEFNFSSFQSPFSFNFNNQENDSSSSNVAESTAFSFGAPQTKDTGNPFSFNFSESLGEGNDGNDAKISTFSFGNDDSTLRYRDSLVFTNEYREKFLEESETKYKYKNEQTTIAMDETKTKEWKFVNLDSYIGENKVVKKIVGFLNNDMNYEFLNQLVGLEHSIFFCETETTSTFQKLKKVTFVQWDSPEYNPNFTYYISEPPSSLSNVKPIYKTLELFKSELGSFGPSILEHLLEKNSGNIFSSVKSLSTVMFDLDNNSEPYVKEMLDYFFKECAFPIEVLSSIPSGSYFHYLIYLCNEYQGGRIRSLYRESSFASNIFDKTIMYGWDFRNQLFESLFLMEECAISLLDLSSISFDEFKAIIRVGTNTLMDCAFFDLSEKNPQLLRKYLTTIVKKDGLNQPFILNLLKSSITETLIIQFLLKWDEVEQDFEINENGDNLLHLIFSLYENEMGRYNMPLIYDLLKKCPNWVKQKNNDGLTPIDIALSNKHVGNIFASCVLRNYVASLREEKGSRKIAKYPVQYHNDNNDSNN